MSRMDYVVVVIATLAMAGVMDVLGFGPEEEDMVADDSR